MNTVKFLSVFFLIFTFGFLLNCSQSNENPDFPIRELDSKNNTPFIFYISGDAGFNTFSKELSDVIYARNFDITALDSKSYFWKEKTPEETAEKIADYLRKKLTGRKNQNVIILGYSFGADVLPFIVNRLPTEIHKKVSSVILMDASKTADFEVSLQGMILDGARGDYQVLPEINKLKVPKTFAIFSNIGMRFPLKDVSVSNFSYIHIPGNHRFNDQYDTLAKLITTENHIK